MKDLEKLLMKKKDSGKMSEQEESAKMDVLMELLEMAQSAMGSRVKSGMDEMQKVSVMAPDKEQLLEGLAKAEEVVEEVPEMEEKEEISEEPKEMSSIDETESEENMFSKREPKEKSKKPMFMMDDEDEE